MLGILPENTFELTDATSDQLDEIIDWLVRRFIVLTKALTNDTGIFGKDSYGGIKGIKWTILRPFAMKLVAPFDFVLIDLDLEDQVKLSQCIKL